MENEIKKHIDKLRKKRVKVALEIMSDSKKKEQIEAEFQYDIWLPNILSSKQSTYYFPKTEKELDLFQLLTLEISYKRTFKSACDDNHPIIKESLKNLGLEKKIIEECVNNTMKFNSEMLDYFILFEEELADSNFSLEPVVLKIDQLASDAKQGAIVSHPAKMTNPSCRYPKIFVEGNFSPDGFIRTGNSPTEFDMHINATKLKIYKFLSLKYQGKTILDYVKESKCSIFEKLFHVSKTHASSWHDSFSSCISNEDFRTDRLVRQIYFPVKKKYHLLSIVQPSGLVFSFKEKIDMLNDRSPEAYIGKKAKKEGKKFEAPFRSISGLTVTKHGGDHPKNISALNNKFQNYYLLSSFPPKVEKRTVRFPKSNFFGESFRPYDYRDIYMALDKIFKTNYNNIKIREGLDYRLQELIDRIIHKMWAIRSVSEKQYYEKSSKLKQHQKIWLCEEFKKKREDSDAWLSKLIKEIGHWIIQSYEKQIGKQAKKMGEAERLHILDIIIRNKEALK